VRLLLGSDLTQAEVDLTRPGADQVQGPPPFGGLAGVTERFAVDGDVLQTKRVGQRFHPATETGLEGLRIQSLKDTFKRVVGGNAVGQGQKGLQPSTTVLSKGDDLLPIIGPGNHRAEGDGDDIDQEVTLQVVAPRVTESGEVLAEGKTRQGHA